MSSHIIVKPGQHLNVGGDTPAAVVGYNANYGTIDGGTVDFIPPSIVLFDQKDASGHITVPATFNNVGTINDVSFDSYGGNGNDESKLGDADAKLINSGTVNLDEYYFRIGPNIMGIGTSM